MLVHICRQMVTNLSLFVPIQLLQQASGVRDRLDDDANLVLDGFLYTTHWVVSSLNTALSRGTGPGIVKSLTEDGQVSVVLDGPDVKGSITAPLVPSRGGWPAHVGLRVEVRERRIVLESGDIEWSGR